MKEIPQARGYTIKIEKHLKDEEGNECYGLTFFEERVIKIDPSIHPTKRSLLHTFIHEQWHGIAPHFNEREVDAWTEATIKELTPQQKTEYFTLWENIKKNGKL